MTLNLLMKLNLTAFQKSKMFLVKRRNASSRNFHLNGLLSGIDDIKVAEFYSNNVPIKSAYEMLKGPNQIYNICFHNAGGNTTKLNENLKSINEKVNFFVESNEVWDRKVLMTSIEDIIFSKGKFVCLLAGKSTGKTLVLTSIEKKFPAKVFKVNLRIHPDILTGLLWTLRDRQHLDLKDNLKDASVNIFSKTLCHYFGASVDTIFTDEDFQKYLKIARPGKQSVEGLQSLIDSLVKNLKGITLVIDEANIALTITDKTSETKIEATKQALALFTSLTKESNQVKMS